MRTSIADTRANEARQLSIGMKRLITGLRLLLEDALVEEGITLAQLRMLSSLNEQADMSAADLARTCFITPQSMQAIVTKAEGQGWITRTPSQANRRILSATLTSEGRRVLERGMELYAKFADDIWGAATIRELRAVNATLAGAVLRLQPKLDDLHARSAASRRKTA